MSLFSFKVSSWTPVAVADTVNFTNLGIMGLMCGTTLQRIDVMEVFMGGVATASAPTLMVVSRDSTVQATPTALSTGMSNAALDIAALPPAAAPVAFQSSGTLAQRSATLGLLALPFNAFGGVVRWEAARGKELRMLGNTASFGEISLSAYTGGTPGLMGAHIIYEPI